MNSKERSQLEKLPPRHRLLYADMAAGLTLTAAAKQRGYSVPHSCKLVRSTEGANAIALMRAEIELALAEALPVLVTRALEVLGRQLESPCVNIRWRAAEFVLKHVSGVIEPTIIIETNANANNSIIEHGTDIK